jgi:2-dehydro-3-deoxyglucarate aldolase/4-hydroxy-2-oxoheptanedioate aldolase
MTALANPFLDGLRAGRRPLGTWLMAAAPATAEALGHVGFDFLVLDMEHVPVGLPELAHLLRAVGCTPAAPVVRLAWNDPVEIKRAMDAGARTLMLPFVQTAEEAAAAARAMRYPPEGSRGVAAVHRASRYGREPDYLARANAAACTIVQLETPEAIDRLPAIAAQPGVDALFVGPGDLAAALGRIGDIAHRDVQALIEKAARDARAAGKPVGIVGPNPAMVARFRDWGYQFAAIASDLAMMTGRAADWLGELRGEATRPAPAAAAY